MKEKNFSQYIENVRIKRMRVDHHKTAANSCACRETRSKVTAYLTPRNGQRQSTMLTVRRRYIYVVTEAL